MIVSRVGGLQTLVEDQKTGLFFDPQAEDAVDQLTHHLETLANNPGQREALGSAGKEEARTRYSWEQITEELNKLYQKAEQHAHQRFGTSS